MPRVKSTEKSASAAAAGKRKAAEKTTEKKSPRRTSGAKVVNSGNIKSNIVLQYSDKEVTYESLVERFRTIWTKELGRKIIEIETVDLYIKPEESKVYYVVGDENGSFDI